MTDQSDDDDRDQRLEPVTDAPAALENLGTWVGGSTVRVRIPQTETTVVGTVHGGDGRRTQILVDSDAGRKNTAILTPSENIVEVIDR